MQAPDQPPGSGQGSNMRAERAAVAHAGKGLRDPRLWMPVAGYCLLIFLLSSIPQLPQPVSEFPDKPAHVVLYAGLGFLTARLLFGGLGLGTVGLCVGAAVFALCYGLSDEAHQMFVPGRNPEFADVLADIIGGLLGASVFAAAVRIRPQGDDRV